MLTELVGAERIQCPEALFKPDLLGIEGEGIHKICKSSIDSCDIDVRKPLCEHILLTGGSTLFEGIKERFHHELSKLSKLKVVVSLSRNRKNSVWEGGAILSALPIFKEICISKEEYDGKKW